MQYSKIYRAMLLVLGISVYSPIGVLAFVADNAHQTLASQQVSFQGTVRSAGNPVATATVSIPELGKEVMTGDDGQFSFIGLSQGRYTLRVTLVGHKTYNRRIQLPMQDATGIVIDMEPDQRQIEDVQVHGRTQVQDINRQAYNVTALDAKSLHNSTLDLSHALDRVSGVRVRESGGVGSSFNFSLNGFSGNHVRFFLDGVPIDNLGSSFQVNNIPINFAERVEVYKGVVPIWLGADALGGAVNIVSSHNAGNYVDVSYSYGSFNTHRSSVNAGMTNKKGFTLQLSAFQNYSDNNYWVTLDEASDASGRYFRNQRLRRFHDQYHNETLVAKAGVVDKSYADRLLLGMTVGQNYKEIQTGARMVSVFGGWHRRGNLLMPSLTYQKEDLFIEGLDVTVNANYNFGEERSIDTLGKRFYWVGEPTPTPSGGGERDGGLYRYRNNNGLAMATVNYRIAENQTFTLNNVFNTFNRKGENELRPEERSSRIPKRTSKNSLGAGYIYDVADRWSLSVFGKLYTQYATTDTVDTDLSGQERYQEARKKNRHFGYGAAASYFINPQLQLKGSYEKSIRLPESDELFGDVENLEGNYRLKPESSHNANIGLTYLFSPNEAHHFSFSGSAIYRYSTDYIYRILNKNQSKYVPANLDGVSNIGGDVEVRYSFRNRLTAGANFTYQNVRNEQKYEPGYSGVSPVYHDRMPNLPYAFGNADASLFFDNVGGKGNRLSIGYNLLYVHQFYLYWPSRGGDKKFVPEQLSHDANVTYTMHDGRYNIALECKNMNDALLYDNFSLQKPSRAFYIKLRYFISKQ